MASLPTSIGGVKQTMRKSRSDNKANASAAENAASQGSARRRRAQLLPPARSDVRPSIPIETTLNMPERPAQRLRRILTSNPHARHFSVGRIISELGEAPQGPTLALFSAAGVFGAQDVGHLSGVVTSGLGAQLVLRRRDVTLSRAVLRQKIPRSSLSTLIDAVANVLEKTEAVVKPRWKWVFHPGIGVALGALLFLLGVASMIPFLGLTVNPAASAFVMSIGLAEQDGLMVVIGVGAAILALAAGLANVISGKQMWLTTRNWLVETLKHLRLRVAAWFLDRIENGLGDLLRIEWKSALLLFLSDFAGPRLEDPTMAGARAVRSLKARAQRIRMARSQVIQGR
jgi:hypothetical protein